MLIYTGGYSFAISLTVIIFDEFECDWGIDITAFKKLLRKYGSFFFQKTFLMSWLAERGVLGINHCQNIAQKRKCG